VTRPRLLIIGGDAAGMTAASQARRRVGVEELEVVAFERGDYSSYSACGIPFFVGGEVTDIEELIARSPEEHRRNGIDMQMRTEVIAIDLRARAIAVRDLTSGTERNEPFDQLVIATGSTPTRPGLPGIDAPGIHGVQTLGDGIALHDDLTRLDLATAHAVVVGAGYVGLELAEALQRRGLHVTVVESGDQPLGTIDPDMAALVAEAIRGLGIDLLTGTTVEAFETGADGTVSAVNLGDKRLPADVVVLGLGVNPDVALARDAGIVIGEAGGIETDARMATSADGVWAAGDCVQCHHRVSNRAVTIALGTHANKQGIVAGINATGGDATFAGVIGTAVTKICDTEVARTGLDEEEARDAGFDFSTSTVEPTTRAGYYPGAEKITVKIVVERTTNRLLGAQIVGKEGAAKRIDVFATAIWNNMTVGEIADLDLGYAPPFSPLWDPVQVAARRSAQQQ
jgi:NADPH-dependent 2,4-dienoyl-CoA reductase/sulfur reductase-like enzyme